MTSQKTLRRVVAAVTAVAVIVLAGCSTQSKKAATPSASGSGTSVSSGRSFPTTATGVTADSIKIGVVYPDFSTVKQYVNIDQGDFQASYNAMIAKINAAGGVNGRKIVPVYGKLDLVSPANTTQTCVQLTDDDKVFAVIGTFTNPDQPLCYAQTHKTAVIGGDETAASLALAQAPWFSTSQGGDAAVAAVDTLSAAGKLTGKKVAVIAIQADQASMEGSAIPELKAKGITPVATAVITAQPSDATAMGTQMGIAAQKFQSAGADTVLIVGGAGGGYTAFEEHISYRPQLMYTSAADAESYVTSNGKHDFTTIANALATDPATSFSDPANLDCMNTIQAAVPGLAGKLTDPQLAAPGAATPATSATAACLYLSLFKAIADKAGKDLNYESFQQAGAALGKIHLPDYTDDANYTATTPSGAIPERLFAFDPSTNHYVVRSS
ncbi:hypothetical protein [Catenulispora rubra]|uniref:hypothetical protein n=1 Tax=Catenulispora rubra TaxID=280293 RepID=UPI00189264D5|nr:hypothetical protein [Catenulispora rubra]